MVADQRLISGRYDIGMMCRVLGALAAGAMERFGARKSVLKQWSERRVYNQMHKQVP